MQYLEIAETAMDNTEIDHHLKGKNKPGRRWLYTIVFFSNYINKKFSPLVGDGSSERAGRMYSQQCSLSSHRCFIIIDQTPLNKLRGFCCFPHTNYCLYHWFVLGLYRTRENSGTTDPWAWINQKQNRWLLNSALTTEGY